MTPRMYSSTKTRWCHFRDHDDFPNLLHIDSVQLVSNIKTERPPLSRFRLLIIQDGCLVSQGHRQFLKIEHGRRD